MTCQIKSPAAKPDKVIAPDVWAKLPCQVQKLLQKNAVKFLPQVDNLMSACDDIGQEPPHHQNPQ